MGGGGGFGGGNWTRRSNRRQKIFGIEKMVGCNGGLKKDRAAFSSKKERAKVGGKKRSRQFGYIVWGAK